MRQNLITNGVGPSSIHLLPALIHQKFLPTHASLANNATEEKAANKQKGTHKGKHEGKRGGKQEESVQKKAQLSTKAFIQKRPINNN